MEFPGTKADWSYSSDARMPTTEVISVAALRLHLLNIVSQGHQMFSSPELQNVEPWGGAPFMNEGLSCLLSCPPSSIVTGSAHWNPGEWNFYSSQNRSLPSSYACVSPCCYFIIPPSWGQNQEEKQKKWAGENVSSPEHDAFFFLFIGLKRAAKFRCHSSNLRAW